MVKCSECLHYRHIEMTPIILRRARGRGFREIQEFKDMSYDVEYLTTYLRGLAKDMTQGDPEAAGVLICAAMCLSDGDARIESLARALRSRCLYCAGDSPTFERDGVVLHNVARGGDLGDSEPCRLKRNERAALGMPK